MYPPRRLAAVLSGLALACGAAGALAAAFGCVLWLAGTPSAWLLGPASVGFAAACGAALGAALGPLALWMLLREVPVGRAVLTGALGATAGGVAARWVPGILAPVCALAGLAAAVALLARQRGGTRVVVPERPNVALQATRYAGLGQRSRRAPRIRPSAPQHSRAPELGR